MLDVQHLTADDGPQFKDWLLDKLNLKASRSAAEDALINDLIYDYFEGNPDWKTPQRARGEIAFLAQHPDRIKSGLTVGAKLINQHPDEPVTDVSTDVYYAKMLPIISY